MKDIEADRKVDRHKGTQIHFYLDEARLKKLDTIAEVTGKSRTAILKGLIDNKDFSKIPDRSCFEVAGQLGRIGGLLKMNRTGGKELAEEVLKIAREIRSKLYAADTII